MSHYNTQDDLNRFFTNSSLATVFDHAIIKWKCILRSLERKDLTVEIADQIQIKCPFCARYMHDVEGCPMYQNSLCSACSSYTDGYLFEEIFNDIEGILYRGADSDLKTIKENIKKLISELERLRKKY